MKETTLQQKSSWRRKSSNLNSNLTNYDETVQQFSWSDVEKEFDWHKTGQVNVVHEMLDRNIAKGLGHKVALYYANPSTGEKEVFTFLDLQRLSAKCAHVLSSHHIKKGDRVAIFLPRSKELYIAFLGALRLGAVPVPLFEAFMEDAVEDRLRDSASSTLITQKNLLERVPFSRLPDLKNLFLTDASLPHAFSFWEEMEKAQDTFTPVWLTLDDGLVLHYTSGSTGRAKGVYHRQYAMVGHRQTALWSLDLKPSDLYWCTADPGWVTGTSYGIFGPWLLGTSQLVLGGRFSAEAWWQAIQDYRVNVWYSAPTAFRMLMKEGKELASRFNLSSLRHIASVGEPLNPEALLFIEETTGSTPHETWWMTETGMHLVCNFPSLDFRVGCTGKPFPGTYTTIINDAGDEVPPNTLGHLAVRPPWPSMMKTIWNNEEKYNEYFHEKGWYLSGDSAYKDEEGYIWFSGREDDVIKTQGERVGPFEVESTLLEHKAVAEAGVIGKPDDLRGNIVKAYVVLRPEYTPSESLKTELVGFVRHHLAPFAAPRELEFLEKLPKTRSGKIMRRVLRAWDAGEPVGDISTMEE